jgi:pimeloyl-ACP methyl ester carboxylesterase
MGTLLAHIRRIRWHQPLRFVTAAVACTLVAGCQEMLARAIVYSPHPQLALSASPRSLPELRPFNVARELRVDVGPPAARLCAWIVDPAIKQGDPRGTILVLHGIRANKLVMLPVARALADADFRAVLVDLRGHGESSGEYLSYGVFESHDLSQVLDELQQRELLAGGVGVYGASYGAGVAIQFAGRDPRVKAVVAVAPFQSLRDVIPSYARFIDPSSTVLTAAFIQQTVTLAGQYAGFDPDQADTIAAIRRTDAHVLLFHGRQDAKIPCEHSQALAAAAGLRAQCVILDHEGHDSIMFDLTGVISRSARNWFEGWLTRSE